MEFPTRFLAFVVLTARGTLAVDNPDVNPSHFCYDDPTCGPTTWGGLCATGSAQSPIDIDTRKFGLPGLVPFVLSSQYSRRASHSFYAQNNGHTAQFEFSDNTAALSSNLTLCGGNMLACYNFAQLHFHWAMEDLNGSEHTVNGERFPLEMHLVHYRTAYGSIAEALRHDDQSAIAVISVLFQIGDHNPYLEPIVAALPSLEEPGLVTNFDLTLRISDLIPHGPEMYARYHGSLTTPTCDEKVAWTVFVKPLTLSQEQMDHFRALRNAEGVSDFNFRPTQALNARRVQIYRNVVSTISI